MSFPSSIQVGTARRLLLISHSYYVSPVVLCVLCLH